jgi:MoxR-like ATPase
MTHNASPLPRVASFTESSSISLEEGGFNSSKESGVSTETVTYLLAQCVEEVKRAYLSDAPHVELIFIALLARGHVLLEGVPGVAKTTLAHAISTVSGCPMKRIQLTPDLLPTDIIGGAIFNPKSGEFEVRRGPIFTHVLLADELNRAPAKTQSALLEAMQESQVTLEGKSESLPLPFFTIATQNPIEQVGVYPLPEAQLDRFALKLEVGYPSELAEVKMLHAYQQKPPRLKSILNPELIVQLQTQVDEVFVHSEILEYIVRLSRATRKDPRVYLGVSPRASLVLTRLCKARAFFLGRDFVSPEDVQSLASFTLSHRIRLIPEAEFESIQPLQVIHTALKKIQYHGPPIPTNPSAHVSLSV